jgi:hypothetical protein
MTKPCLISQRIQHVSTAVSMNIAKNLYNEISKVVENKKGKIGQYVTRTLLQTIYYFDYK